MNKILSTRDYVDLAVSAHNLDLSAHPFLTFSAAAEISAHNIDISAHPSILNELNTKLDLDQTISQRVTGGYPFFTQGISSTDIKFNTSHVGPYNTGEVGWDANERCVSIGMGDDVVLQVGKELLYEVENNTGSQIPNGTVVRWARSIGNSGKINVTLGLASTAFNAYCNIGLATEDINDGSTGYVTTYGYVRGVDTRGGSEDWQDATELYVSHLSAGKLTKNIPPAPYPVIRMGGVINAATNGIIMVRPQYGYNLKDLNDVNGTPLSASGQIPVWNNSRAVFDFDYNITDYAKASAVNSSVNTVVQSNSANWNSVVSTVQANSATNWNYQGTDLKALSGNWQSAYTTVNSNSANWSTTPVVTSVSDTNLLSYYTISGNTIVQWSTSTEIDYTKYILSFSEDMAGPSYEDFPFKGQSVEITPNYQGGFNILLGDNWYAQGGPSSNANIYNVNFTWFWSGTAEPSNVPNTYIGIDSNPDDEIGPPFGTAYLNYATRTVITSTVYTIPLSTQQNNWNNAYTNLVSNSAAYLTSVDISLIASTSGNWNSTYTTVNTNSANWNYQGTDLKALSGNWQNTYNTVSSLSGNWSAAYDTVNIGYPIWNSTHTTVNSNSAKWDSTYTSVQSTSGKWNSAYNSISNYAPLSGATFTGNITSPNYFLTPSRVGNLAGGIIGENLPILEFGLNASQFGSSYDSTQKGGLFRLDMREGNPFFQITRQPKNENTEYYPFFIDDNGYIGIGELASLINFGTEALQVYGDAHIYYGSLYVDTSVLAADATIGTVSATSLSAVYSHFGSGNNYTYFDSNGTLMMKGNATVFRDEKNDALGLRQTGPGLSTNTTELVQEFLGTADTNDYLYCNVQLNHDVKHGAKIYPHVHWLQAASGIPNFLIQYRWQTDGVAKVTAWTNYALLSTDATYTSGTIPNISYNSTGVTPPSTQKISDIVQFRIIRDTTNSSGLFPRGTPDRYGNTTVGVLAFDVHVELDQIGSNQEYVK